MLLIHIATRNTKIDSMGPFNIKYQYQNYTIITIKLLQLLHIYTTELILVQHGIQTLLIGSDFSILR